MVESIRLHNSRPRPGAVHRRKRLGCGESSGHGKTSGKGHKGQKARSGGSIRLGFEGGQMPLIRRIPKRGFSNEAYKIYFAPVNLRDLERFDTDRVVDERTLREVGLVNGRWDGVKILGDGELTHKVSLKIHAISASARQRVEGLGGAIELIPSKQYPARNSAKVLRQGLASGKSKNPAAEPEKSIDKYSPFTREQVVVAKKAAEESMGYRLHAIRPDVLRMMEQGQNAKGPLPAIILQNNVHAIGFGRKYVDGQQTGVKAIRFYVFTKATQAQIPEKYLLPKTINGISTDVIEMAPPRILALHTKLGGSAGSVSGVSNPQGRPGTLGAFCKSLRAGEEKKVFLLSCMHVLFADPQNEEIHHAMGRTATRHIANRSRSSALEQNNASGEKLLTADAAIAELLEDHTSLESSICHLASARTSVAEESWPVTKRGLGSGSTKGIVLDADFDLEFDLPGGPFRLQNQIVVWSPDKISDSGDSGALLVHGDRDVVGICYAGGSISVNRLRSPVILDYTFGNVLLASRSNRC